MPIAHVKNITIADGTDTNVVRPSDWNSVHAYTLVDGVSIFGNTAGAAGLVSSGTLYLAGGNNMVLSQNANSVTVLYQGIDGLGISNVGNFAGTTGIGTNSTFLFVGGNNITLSQSTDTNGNTISFVGPTLPAGFVIGGNTSGATASMTSGTVLFAGGNNITLSQNANSVTIVGAAGGAGVGGIGMSTGGNTAGVSGIMTNKTMVLAGTGIVSLSQTTDSNGYTLSIGAQPVGPTAVIFGGNTAGATASVTTGTLGFYGGNNITLSQNANSVTVSQYDAVRSVYENLPCPVNTTQSINQNSLSIAESFILPYPVSASFIRIPASFSTSSGSVASAAAALNCSCGVFTTWNAVVYSVGTGASSRSLISVASGSNGWSFTQSLSVQTNGTQYSLTQGWTGFAEGNSTSFSTSFAASTSLYSSPVTFFTQISGARFLDINFNNSLSAGAYWLVLGNATSSTSNSVNVTPLTACGVRYQFHYGVSQTNQVFAIMGSTNQTSGGMLGAGSFSTVGGGTTSAFPISAISSSAGHIRPYFQMIRSA